MRFCLHVEPTQVGATYDELLRFARKAEDCGFYALFRSDHLLPFGPAQTPVRASDAWVSLAGLARETDRIRLGTLVSPLTFRWPGHLAVQVAQVDEMSGGRVELGLGTGWFEQEHRAYGIPFPDKRFQRLEEQLEILDGLLSGEPGPFSYSGRSYELDAVPRPPAQQSPRPPIIVGGMGGRRTPALAARYADEFNALAAAPLAAAELFQAATEARGAREGRTPLEFSVLQDLCAGDSDSEVERRARVFGQPMSSDAFVGSADAVVEQVGRYAEAGATRVYLRTLDLSDLDQVEFVAAKVVPQLR